MPIPRRIIQTHRDPAILQPLRQRWQDLHPGYEYLFFDNDACRHLIEQRFAPLLPTYDKLPLPVQKADLFRYAAVYDGGGLYADTDTECHVPLHEYVDLTTDDLVVGIEMTPRDFKQGMQRYVQQYCSPHQILQWNFCAPPRHPALGAMLERIHFLTANFSREELARYSEESRFTLELTGPVLFTQVVNQFLSGGGQGRITVLPRLWWGAWPGEHRDPGLQVQIKVRHLYEGTWKPAKPMLATPKVKFKIGV